MAQTTQRAFALSLAILFIITTVGFSGYVVWEMFKGKDSQSQSIEQELANSAKETKQEEDPLKGQPLDNFTPMPEVTELKIEDTKIGEGAEAKPESSVTVHYTGAIASTGKIFESSLGRGEPVSFPLAGVIAGWKEGIPGMKEGGKRRLIIPAEKAYGEQSPSPDIPPNSDLVFDVELIKVQ